MKQTVHLRKPLLTRPYMVFLIALLCSILWGSAFPAVKTGYILFNITGSIPGKLFFASFRFLIAGLMIFFFLKISGKSVLLSGWRQYSVVLLLGFIQTTLQYAFFFIGLGNTTGVKAAIITASGSFFMALFSHWWIANDSFSKKKIAGLVLGFTGVVLVNFNKNQLDFVFHLNGEGLLILTALLSALGSLLVKKKSPHISPPLLSAYQLTFGSLILLAFSFTLNSPTMLSLNTSSLLILFYLSFVSASAFSLWYLLIKYNHLTQIAVYRFMIPICGAILSVIFLKGESFTWLSIAALIMVSGGITMVYKK